MFSANHGAHAWVMRAPGRVLLALLPLSVSACADWPHFDYAAVDEQQVQEMEAEGGEAAQNLLRLYGDVKISGQISTSGYTEAAPEEIPFGLPGWYSGDIDYFQFVTWDRFAGMSLSLSWAYQAVPGSVLDLYFFTLDPETGEPSLIEFVVGGGTGMLDLPDLSVDGETLYALGVAGRSGTAVEYQLRLSLLEAP